MENLKFTVRMIAAFLDMSVAQLARTACIDEQHLRGVARGDVKMTGEDLLKLAAVSGIPTDRIFFGDDING